MAGTDEWAASLSWLVCANGASEPRDCSRGGTGPLIRGNSSGLSGAGEKVSITGGGGGGAGWKAFDSGSSFRDGPIVAETLGIAKVGRAFAAGMSGSDFGGGDLGSGVTLAVGGVAPDGVAAKGSNGL